MNATQTNQDVADFSTIEGLLSSAILPPALNAELYRALGDIPTIKVKSHIADVDGRAGVAFVLPETSQSANLEIILDATSCGYLAQAAWQPSNGTPNSAIAFTETAVLHTTLVSGPGRTAADLAPPSRAVLAAEQATIAVLAAGNPGPSVTSTDPGRLIYRELAAAGGTREIWARVDDTSQASYVHGRLVTCARPASGASGTMWLMPAGPAYPVVYPSGAAARNPQLPGDPQALLDKLNTYRAGCTDTAAYCNAVSVFANMLLGYGNTLLGYGAVTLLLQQANVSGPGVRP